MVADTFDAGALLNDPDWPLALEALTEANGYSVERLIVSTDVWAALDALPRGEGRVPHELGVPIYRDIWMAPGDGFAILKNGKVRRIFGKPSTPNGGSDHG